MWIGRVGRGGGGGGLVSVNTTALNIWLPSLVNVLVMTRFEPKLIVCRPS